MALRARLHPLSNWQLARIQDAFISRFPLKSSQVGLARAMTILAIHTRLYVRAMLSWLTMASQAFLFESRH